jgi:hypothetical protein
VKAKTKILALSFCCSLAASAAGLPIDEDKILFDYKKRFNNIISSNIFSTPAELRSNMALRDSIFDYLSKENAGQPLVKPAELEELWAYYIETKFGSKEAFTAKVKAGYLNEADVKARFKDNLVLLRYFKKSVEPRIKEDLQQRGRVLDYAEEHNISYESEAIKHEFFNTVEAYGGQKRFDKYLRENSLSVADVFYFIKSDFLAPLIKEDLFVQKLRYDSSYRDNIEKDIQEHYKNHKETLYHIPDKYYFSQIYIPKQAGNPIEQKATVTKLLAELQSSNPVKETVSKFPGAKHYKLQEPLASDSKLYSATIKSALIGKAAGHISSILENKSAYYIVILDSVDTGRYISYDEVHDEIYLLIKARRLKDLEIPALDQV